MRKGLAVLAAVVFTAACSKSAPMRPSEAAAGGAAAASADARASVTITAPQLVSPAAGARLAFAQQPLTLTIKNAVATSARARTYTFQVATDGDFKNIAYSKEGVAEGESGQTSLVIDKLAGDRDYFWRALAVSGSSEGPFAPARLFNVGPEVVLQAPVPISPADGGQLGQGSLVTGNASRTGPAGPITYKFEVSSSSGFGSTVFSRTVAEGIGQTSAIMDVKLTTGNIYYWRVQAIDATNNITGPFSVTRSFKYVPFDLSQAVMENSPKDFADWPETAKITSIQFNRYYFAVDFDKRDGPGRWPDMTPPGWSGALQYTLGMCGNLGGTWHCAAIVQFWHGRTLTDSAPPSWVHAEWFYGRWGALNGWQPQDGELVGLFVGSGNLRDGGDLTRATCPAVCERSNVALVPWSNYGDESYVYSLGRLLLGR
ncbi:MAG: hypothetical protein IT176_04610 [Acidobacteria bacterium]|nr:hypothetical protein [Acidobacteriota bacterium]